MSRTFGSFGEFVVEGFLPSLVTSGFPTNGWYNQVTGINATAGLTEVLAATGKFELSGIWFSGLTSSDMTKLKLTIDGVDIYNEDPFTPPSGAGFGLFGSLQVTSPNLESYVVNQSLSLSVQMATDTDITIQYVLRPIK